MAHLRQCKDCDKIFKTEKKSKYCHECKKIRENIRIVKIQISESKYHETEFIRKAKEQRDKLKSLNKKFTLLIVQLREKQNES